MGDAGPPPDVDAEACIDDLYGPAEANRPDFGFGRVSGLVLCPGVRDVFGLALPVGAGARIRVEGAPVPVRLEIRRGDLLVAEAPLSRPEVALSRAEGGEHLSIWSESGTRAEYTLDIASTDLGCALSGTLTPGQAGPVTLCGGAFAIFGAVEVPMGTRVEQCVEVRSRGTAVLTARCEGDDPAAPSALARQAGLGTFCAGLGPFGQPLRPCVFGLQAGGDGPVTVVPLAPTRSEVPGGPVRVSGSLEVVPAPGLEPPVVPTWGGEVLVQTATGATSAASAVDDAHASFEMQGYVEAAGPSELVVAAMDWRLGVTVAVSPGEVGAAAWQMPLASTSGDVAAGEPWRLVEADVPEVAALHAVRVLAGGLERLQARLGVGANEAEQRLLHVRWAPGRAAPCGTCFVPGPFPLIELSGRPGDPDAWDDAVILHELGHWVATAFGRDDSPGGAHDGSRVAGAIAWSEGFADFHAAWQQGDPVLLDRRADGPRTRDLDAASEDEPLATGTSDGTADGLVSERLVSALLWDVAALGVDEVDLFAAALGAARVWRGDRGPPGFDLNDYLDVLGCRLGDAGRTAPWEAVVALVRGRGVPYEEGAAACP